MAFNNNKGGGAFTPSRKVMSFQMKQHKHGEKNYRRATKSVVLRVTPHGFEVVEVNGMDRWRTERIGTTNQLASANDILICSIVELDEGMQKSDALKSKGKKADTKDVLKGQKSWSSMYKVGFGENGRAPCDTALVYGLQAEIWAELRAKLPILYNWLNMENIHSLTEKDYVLPKGCGWDGSATQSDTFRFNMMKEHLPHVESDAFHCIRNHFLDGMLYSPNPAVKAMWTRNTRDVKNLQGCILSGEVLVKIVNPLIKEQKSFGWLVPILTAKRNMGRGKEAEVHHRVIVPRSCGSMGLDTLNSLYREMTERPALLMNTVSIEGAEVYQTGDLKATSPKEVFGFEPDFLMVLYAVVVPCFTDNVWTHSPANDYAFTGFVKYCTQPKAKY